MVSIPSNVCDTIDLCCRNSTIAILKFLLVQKKKKKTSNFLRKAFDFIVFVMFVKVNILTLLWSSCSLGLVDPKNNFEKQLSNMNWQ